jgi:glycosyltransferase involved in cell wall biosynthesis
MPPFSFQSDIELCLVMRHVWPVLAGAAERFRRYAPGLLERGVHMTAFARQAENGQALDEVVPGDMRVLRVAASADAHVWDRALFERLQSHSAAHAGRQMVLQTNVVHTQTRSIIKKVCAGGVPAVWTGSMMEENTEVLPWWRHFRERVRRRWLHHSFDAFTVGSSLMRDWLRNEWVPPERIHVIGHGVDHARFRPVSSATEKDALRQIWHLPVDAVVILMVGTITARKGVHLLLDSWEKSLVAEPSAHLVLAGAFDRPTVVHEAHQRELGVYQQGVHAQLQRLTATGRVHHLGEVADIHLLMRACDILVLPSDREGVPNVVLEAMSCGLPCVLTPFVGLPREELGPEGKNWVLTERTSFALAEVLGALIHDEIRRKSIGAAAYQQALDHFGLDKTLDAYEALYRNLLRKVHG